MDWLTDPQLWISFCTLTLLEVVLGIDNVVFVSILADKLPAAQQPRARRPTACCCSPASAGWW